MPLVQRERLRGDEMHWDGVARERVQHDHVVPLRRLGGQRHASIARHHFDAGGRVANVREEVSRHRLDGRIDVIKANHVAWTAVGRHRAGAESDHSDAARAIAAAEIHREADAGVSSVIRRWNLVQILAENFLPVLDDAVVERANDRVPVGVLDLRHVQDAIEVSRPRESVLAVVMNLADHDRHHAARENDPERTREQTSRPRRREAEQRAATTSSSEEQT